TTEKRQAIAVAIDRVGAVAPRIEFEWKDRVVENVIQSGIELACDCGSALSEVVINVNEARTVFEADGVGIGRGDIGHATVGMRSQISEIVISSPSWKYMPY